MSERAALSEQEFSVHGDTETAVLRGQDQPDADLVVVPFVGHDARPARLKHLGKVARRDLLAPLQFAADIAVIVLIGLAVGTACNFVHRGTLGPLRDFVFTGIAIALLVSILRFVIISNLSVIMTSGMSRMQIHLKSWTLAFGVFIFFLYALKASAEMSREFLFLFYASGLVVMAVWRVLVPPKLARVSRSLDWSEDTCVLIGEARNRGLRELAKELDAMHLPEPKVIEVDFNCQNDQWAVELTKTVRRVERAARFSRNGELYLCSHGAPEERLADLSRALSILPRTLYVIPDWFVDGSVAASVTVLGTKLALEVRRRPLNFAQRATKRAIDVVLSLMAMAAFFIPFLAIAALIKLDSRGPVFFRQTRTGYCGRAFRIFKFRTMTVLEDGRYIKQACQDDPRVTRVGRVLRRFSFDELPQLLNVVKGEMSLVGPRPHAVAHDRFYGDVIRNYEIRQHVKPGITGWAQIHGLRGETSSVDQMYRRIEFDLWYALHASILLDLGILLRTFWVVLVRRNAY